MDATTNFPAEPFGTDPRCVDALCKLGLVSRVTPAAALKMAKFVEASFKRDSKEGHSL